MPNGLDKSMKSSIIGAGHWSLLQGWRREMDCGWSSESGHYLSCVDIQSGDGVGGAFGSVMQLPFFVRSSVRDHKVLSFAQLRYLLFQGRIRTAIRVFGVMMFAAFQFVGFITRNCTPVFVSMSFSLNHRK
jgi:hypothetical protein